MSFTIGVQERDGSPPGLQRGSPEPILGASQEWEVLWRVSLRCRECYIKKPRGDQFEAPTEELNWEPWDQIVGTGGGQP